MRVAYRRSDGGWFFDAARAGPSVDLQREPTTTTMFSARTKEKKLHPGELTTRGYVEHDFEGNPPPAYHADGSAYSQSSGLDP